MATRTRTRASNSTRSNDRSAFNWGNAGTIAGVALGGAALAFAANLGRKFATQGVSAMAGDWDESLAAEHQAVLTLFDKMLETEDSQTVHRKMLLMKLGHMLDKHAYAEEHVIYPALREANEKVDADELEREHGEVKTFLYRLQHMATDDPQWLDTIREFRTSVEAHAKMEEEQVFPRLKSEISEELNKRLTKELNKAGFMMA